MGSATALASSSGALEAKVLACLCRPLLPKRAIDACPANAEPSRNIGRTELLLGTRSAWAHWLRRCRSNLHWVAWCSASRKPSMNRGEFDTQPKSSLTFSGHTS